MTFCFFWGLHFYTAIIEACKVNKIVKKTKQSSFDSLSFLVYMIFASFQLISFPNFFLLVSEEIYLHYFEEQNTLTNFPVLSLMTDTPLSSVTKA